MTRNVALRQGGAALVVGMIMLLLITVMLFAALNLGTTNFRSVSNMQFRNEAVAAADAAIEQVISSPFTDAPVAETINIDIDNSGSLPDYVVEVAEPECIFATQAFGADPSSLSLPTAMTVASTWNTVWDLDATAGPAGNAGGAEARVRAGVRVLLTEAQKNAVCP
jgi:hypothetical protein